MAPHDTPPGPVRDLYITERELGELTGLSQRTLANWRAKRIGPKFVRGKRVLYPKQSVLAWLNSRLVETDDAT